MLLVAGLCLGIICSFIPSAKAFSDIGDSSVAKAVAVLSSMDIVSGYSDGGYHPSDLLTRSQFCKLAVLAENHGDQLNSSAYRSLFSDVGSTNWALSYVNLAYTEGLVQGYGDGTFGPDDPVTCGQAVTIALRILGYTTDDVGPFWPEDYMEKASALGLLDGISKGASESLTRGDAALLLYNLLNQETADGDDYLATYANSTVSSAVVLDNDAEADDGTAHTAEVYSQNTGSVTYYDQFYTLDDYLVGYRGTLLLDKTGKVIGFVPDDNVMKSISLADETASGITDSNGNTYTISSSIPLVMDDEETTYGSGWYNLEGRSTVNIFYSDSGSIDLVVASETERYEGTLITGYYENASPNSTNPSTITIAGLTLDVDTSALKALRNFSVGDQITVSLSSDGDVAAAYSATAKTAEMIGILGSGKVTLTNGLVLTGTISTSMYEGSLVRVNSSGVGKLSAYALSTSNSSKLDVVNGTLGSSALADDVAIYDYAGVGGKAVRIELSDIYVDTVSSSRIDYVHRNSSGEVDILLLDDVTGDCYTYGIVKRTVTNNGKTGINETESIAVTVTNSDGTSSSYAYSGSLSSTSWIGGLAVTDDGNVTGMASLTKVISVSRSSFSSDGDQQYVEINGTTIPVSDDVQVYNSDTEEWITLAEAKAYTDTFTVYYDKTLTTGAQARVIYTQ